MASVTSLKGAFDLEHRGLGVRSFLKTVTTYWDAIREGGAAAHEYEQLIRRGTPHEEAIVQVFEQHFGRR